MSLIPLQIKGISYSQTKNGAYALILNEKGGSKSIPIVIGAFEAQSIAIALETDINPPRPLTHDLFKNFATAFNITVKEVVIHKLVDGIFFANVICLDANTKEITLDARTSDAIALAVRFNAPIFTYENILNKAGIHLETRPVKETEKQYDDEVLTASSTTFNTEKEEIISSNKYEKYSLQQLQEMLSIAIENENYEEAAKLRDQISNKE